MVRTMITMSPASKRLLDALARQRKNEGRDRATRVDILEEAFDAWQREHPSEVLGARAAAAAEGEVISRPWRRNEGRFSKAFREPTRSACAV